MVKTVILFLSLGLPAPLCLSSDSLRFQEKEKVTIAEPIQFNSRGIFLQADSSPKFTFFLGSKFLIRKTGKAAMYEYKPQKPVKPYLHLTIFLELLERETKMKLPPVDIFVVTRKEYSGISEGVGGIVWMEPQIDATAKPRGSSLLWSKEKNVFKVLLIGLKEPERVLTLELFLAHLALLTEWELSVGSTGFEEAEDLVDKREEEWKKQERKALVLFAVVSGHWRLLQLDWPPIAPRRSLIIPLPSWLPSWPLWPKR